MIIIIRETSKNIHDFILIYFVNLITFISEYYITFIYIISRGFFIKISKSTKKKTLRTSYKVVIVLIYPRNFDL